ncbi:hypothetical protein [Grimontia sp. NTOU-MAR1]|uniref:hypothetical protein n=1 Tax=Grimontia sp. NTOU-MAR1 TaxID=3111011 RepID=UPI002DBD0E7B|nr:hypothetical protein [Grimontia sp. NTOU-MAR1]WRV97734.1 hypothetical protein VP504_17140 [Grimontia sp. NTOU-MAR1]
MKKQIAMCGLLLSFASLVNSAEAVNSTVSKVRVHTEVRPTAAVRQFVTIQLNESLGGGCEWLFLNSKDENAVNQVLTAKTSGHTITVHYDYSDIAPWHVYDTCAVTAVGL